MLLLRVRLPAKLDIGAQWQPVALNGCAKAVKAERTAGNKYGAGERHGTKAAAVVDSDGGRVVFHLLLKGCPSSGKGRQGQGRHVLHDVQKSSQILFNSGRRRGKERANAARLQVDAQNHLSVYAGDSLHPVSSVHVEQFDIALAGRHIATGQLQLTVLCLRQVPVDKEPQPLRIIGVIWRILPGKHAGVDGAGLVHNYRHVGPEEAGMLDQSREFSQQRPRPPHRLRVPVSEAVPEAPYVLPRLKTDAVEEGLLDAVNVVVGPPLAEVGQVLAEGDRLVGGNERGPENILMFRRLARPADKLFPKQTPRWCTVQSFL